MDLLAPVRRFDRFQQRHKRLAIPMAVVKKFGDDQAGSLAALVAYFAFFSLFPLLLVFLTVLGYVLQGDASAQTSIVNSALKQFPVIGPQLTAKGGVTALHGHALGLIIGLTGALFGALGVTNAAQNAFDRVWAVPFKDRPNFLQARLRGLALLITVGLLFVASTLASGIVSGGGHGPLVTLAGIALSLALNFALFFAAFRLLTAASVATRCLWIGVVVASVLWEILQVLGGYYIGHVLRHTSSAYGAFGFVLALLTFLHLGAQLTIYAAEINVVVARNLWPRSLFGPKVRADEETLTALAKVEERSDEEQIEVSFSEKK